jgi:uncharacterized protein YbjT (DUF2867 family)
MSFIDPTKPIVLVYLAAGVQGRAVVHAALAQGFPVRALVRNLVCAPTFPSGVHVVQGDLDDPISLRAASAGAGCAVLQIPTGSLEVMEAQARNAAEAWGVHGPRPLVLKLASASRPAPCAEPSFVANARVEDVLRQAGLRFASVRPTMYLDNLLKPSACAEIMSNGVFAPPIMTGQCIAWTSADDCARAAITLLERGVSGDHRIAGAHSLDGNALAAQITAGLGHPVVYRAQAIDEFEREVDAAMGEGMGRRIASKFRYFADHPDDAENILARPFTASAELDGFEPTDVQTWVRAHRLDFMNGAG